MEATALALSLPAATTEYETRWFSAGCCVEVRGTQHAVVIGGELIGQFDGADPDRGPRNVLLVSLARTGAFFLEHLATAFGIGAEYLRRLRHKADREGLGAVVVLRRLGGKRKVTDAREAWMVAQFAAGLTPAEVARRQPKRGRVHYQTVLRAHRAWRATRSADGGSSAAAASSPAIPAPAPAQLALWPVTTEASAEVDAAADSDALEEAGAVIPLAGRPIRSGQHVQHLGSWLMLALVGELGVHAAALALRGASRRLGLRIALDAVVVALAIGERCVEGVRRLQTPSASLLLRAERAPSATWVRRTLWSFADDHATAFAARMAEQRIAAARTDDDSPAVFYVDNHLRPYTGKYTVRRGWRMQDKRAKPGTSDYYVHDESGLPLFRIAVPSHDSLSAHLLPVATTLRDALGKDQRILLAFDRAGAYADVLARLRDHGFECVTYERKPYDDLPASRFRAVEIGGDTVDLHEGARVNLGDGRGRVRRIAIRTTDGRQVNFLASSRESAASLVAIQQTRWNQENGFKHGVERWGINQLDGRRLAHYPPGTMIPNPARRLIDRAMRIARLNEGNARRKLARLDAADHRRQAIDQDLAEAVALQDWIAELRPFVKDKAPVEQTNLAGRLVRHTGELKEVVDTLRVACANAESELATLLAPHLVRPREAKKVAANLFKAPGRIDVTADGIRVRLTPAANPGERRAMQAALVELSERNLLMPDDPGRRPLRFEVHLP